jgi:hypothetical protein
VVAWKEVQTSEVSTARNLEEKKKSDVRKLEENFFFSRSSFRPSNVVFGGMKI